MKSNNVKNIAGRTHAVFVFGQGDSAAAVISTITAKIISASDKRIQYAGPVTLSEETASHIENTILNLVDSVLNDLDIKTKNFQISIANPSVASMLSIGSEINGYSFDVPILITLLSATLNMEVPQNLISTGHIASLDGDIRMVKSLSTKIVGITQSGLLQTFIYPEFNNDDSLKKLCASERTKILDEVVKAKNHIKLIALEDTGSLLKAVFSEEQMVLASLKHGYFDHNSSFDDQKIEIARILLTDNNGRFWRVIEKKLLSGKSESVKRLLAANCQFHIKRKIYPSGLGNGLIRLLYTIPPVSNYREGLFPLLPISKTIKLSQFAKKHDEEDIITLFSAISGEFFQKDIPPVNKAPAADQVDNRVQLILDSISNESLYRKIGNPLDTARISFSFGSNTVKNADEFDQVLNSYYAHMLRHFHGVLGSIKKDIIKADAIALIEETFGKREGYKIVLADAKNGTNGGIRTILDKITDRFKADQQEKFIGLFLTSNIDSLAWDEKILLVRALLRTLEKVLPKEITSQPPERFANDIDIIARAYAQSMDSVRRVLNSL